MLASHTGKAFQLGLIKFHEVTNPKIFYGFIFLIVEKYKNVSPYVGQLSVHITERAHESDIESILEQVYFNNCLNCRYVLSTCFY